MVKTIIGVVVLLIIVVGGYFVLKGHPANAPTVGTTNAAPGASGQSLKALVAAGAPVTCSYATTTNNVVERGTIYIANGQVAGDFNVTGVGSNPIEAHMIVRDNTSYVWSSMSTQGFKSTVSASGNTGSGPGSVNYDAPLSYSCQPWTPDSSKFNLPTGITFTASASYTPPASAATGVTGAGGSSVKGSAAQCAQCDSLPSVQKAQCLAALQC